MTLLSILAFSPPVAAFQGANVPAYRASNATGRMLPVTLLGLRRRSAKVALATKELAEKNAKAGESFLNENRSKAGVVALPSGLQYKILKTGRGNRPKSDDNVVCHYRGTLVDGTEFDNSYRRGRPATFAVNRVIQGWGEALQLMPVGSKWQLFVPSNLAYGERRAGGVIGPNATLIFEVELIAVDDGSTTDGRSSQEPGVGPDVGAKPVASNGQPGTARAPVRDIQIAFEVDPSSDPGSEGQHWISRPFFTAAVQIGKEATVEAKVVGIAADGTEMDTGAEWTPADPEMVTVTPGPGKRVKLTVRRAGESKLTVVSNGISKELLIMAESVDNTAMQVTLAQKQ